MIGKVLRRVLVEQEQQKQLAEWRPVQNTVSAELEPAGITGGDSTGKAREVAQPVVK